MSQEHRSRGRGASGRSQRGRNQHNASYSQSASMHLKSNETVDDPMPVASSEHDISRNDRFTHFICALLGKRVHLQVKNGRFYDGVLTTFSKNCEFVLSKVHLVEVEANGKLNWSRVPNKGEIVQRIVFNRKDIVSISCPKVDLEECVKGDSFQTDADISHCYNGEVKEKELQPWKPDGDCEEVPMIGTKYEKSSRWEADDMFKVNEQVYGVTSNFDSSMASYTTEIKRTDTEEYYEKLKKAEKIAKEIQQDQFCNEQIDSGKSEEELYSAVVRQPTQRNINSSTPGNKYVPPHARAKQAAPFVIERKEKGANVDSRKTPSPNANSPISSRKLNGDDPKQKSVDSEQTSKTEIKEQSPKSEVKISQEVRPEKTEKLKEKLLSPTAKPIHRKIEERAIKAQKPVSTEDLKKFSSNFNLSLGSETQNKAKMQMPETQDIRKLEEFEKLQNKEAHVPVTSVQSRSSNTSPPLSNHETKASSNNSVKANTTETGQTSPATKSTLNPNAKEFKLNPNAKTFVPKPPSPSQSQGIPTPTQTPTAITQPPLNMVQQRMSYQPMRPRTRMGFAQRSEYPEYPSTSPMTAAVATGTPIMAPTMVFQPPFVPNQGMVPPGMPIQGPYIYTGPQRYMAPVSYNMAISATPSGMPSNQGTMVTAGSFQPGTGTFPEGAPMPVYVTQAGNMAAPQHLLPGQHQSYQPHVIATTPPGPPPPPHQSPQPHQQPIFFQHQTGGSQPPPNQTPHILQPAPPPVGMGQPAAPPGHPAVLVMSQTPPNIAQSSPYIR